MTNARNFDIIKESKDNTLKTRKEERKMRKPQISRTVHFFDNTVKVYKKGTDEVLTTNVKTLAGSDKAVKDALPDEMSLVTVIERKEITETYTMPLSTFIETATPTGKENN